MASSKTLTRSFAGGEITPEMYGRLDNVKFQTGLALARNGIVLPHGPFTKRPGFAFVREAGVSASPVRIIPFSFSATQTMVLELGHLYMRFHTMGGTLLDTGVPYVVATPYQATDLSALKFTQSADVITITCTGYQTRELRRLGAVNWTLTVPTLGSSPAAPTSPTATVSGSGGTAKNYYYKVTTVTPDGLEESLPVGPTTVAAVDLTVVGNKVTVAWTAPAGITAPSYRVYKTVGGSGRLYGFMGETTDVNFIDDNITPDYSRNPPASVIRLDTVDNYPGAVTYFEQRRCFAGTVKNPQAVYMTRTATESNLAVSNPSNSGDAVSFTIKAQQQNAIRHLVPLGDLLAFSVSGVWRVYANNNGAILPSTVAARPQTYYGSSDVAPQLTGNNCLYIETNGRGVRDISYSNDAQGYTSDNRSVMAPHLFQGYTLVDMAFTKSPDAILWCVRSDGALLSMTYVPEHQVFAWTQHQTDGAFESVCVVAENNEDVLYAVVRRVVNGSTLRYIERMSSRQFATQSDAFFVDAGATYSGAPVSTLSGLTWLEGKTVVALADGAVVQDLVVTGGAIALPVAASKVHVGLPYVTEMQTLPLAIENMPAGGQGTQKAINNAYVRVNRTGLLQVGPTTARLVDVPTRTNEPYDSPPRLISEQVDLMVDPDWGEDAQLWIRSDTPTPLTVSSITMDVATGG